LPRSDQAPNLRALGLLFLTAAISIATFVVSDLYAMGFNPVSGRRDFLTSPVKAQPAHKLFG